MKMTRSILALAAAVLLGFAVRGQTQAPAGPKSNLQILQELKTANQTQLDKQTALLTTLEELQKQASQTKFLTKRG